MYGIYANIGCVLMVNVTIYSSTMDPMGYKMKDSGTVFFRDFHRFTCASRVELAAAKRTSKSSPGEPAPALGPGKGCGSFPSGHGKKR